MSRTYEREHSNFAEATNEKGITLPVYEFNAVRVPLSSIRIMRGHSPGHGGQKTCPTYTLHWGSTNEIEKGGGVLVVIGEATFSSTYLHILNFFLSSSCLFSLQIPPYTSSCFFPKSGFKPIRKQQTRWDTSNCSFRGCQGFVWFLFCFTSERNGSSLFLRGNRKERQNGHDFFRCSQIPVIDNTQTQQGVAHNLVPGLHERKRASRWV